MTLGPRIRELRQLRGLSQAEVAARAELSRLGYIKVENDVSDPRPDTLARIARALHVRLDELVAPRPALRHVRFRARNAMKRRGQLLIDVGRMLRDHLELEALTGEQRPRDGLASLIGAFDQVAAGPERARGAAERARAAFGLTSGDAIRDLPGLLEDRGVALFRLSLQSEWSGLSVGPEDGGPAVALNDTMTVERQRHTAAHELGHILLHRDAFDVEREREDKLEEKEADVFASHFLMPGALFDAEWGEARGLGLVDRVLKVKHIFGVSWQAVLVRAYPDDPKIWPRFYSLYARQRGRKLKKTDEPEPLQPSEFRTDRRERLLRQAIEQDLISELRAAEILGGSIKELRAFRDAWA
jgi:Zn-dependent peptidase ImmA (M78 family)/transcriptional regulator with XRE-family HTH domain